MKKDKLKKWLLAPVVCHLAMFVAFTVLLRNSDWMSSVIVELFIGGIVTPMYFAILSMAHAIVNEGKVYDYIYTCLLYLGVIALLRAAAYFVLDGGMAGVMIALMCLVVSVGIFTIWDCLFAFTDHMMKKKPRKKAVKQ